MIGVEHVLAVVAVSDITAAREWYVSLFGREPDNAPMPGLVEWHVTDGGWVQVTEDPRGAGHGMLNLAVSDIEDSARELHGRGMRTGEIVEADKGVRLCAIADPDGNRITLIGNFREEY